MDGGQTNHRRPTVSESWRQLERQLDEARDWDAEAAVLGSMLLLGGFKWQSKPRLSVNDFDDAPHRTLYTAFLALEKSKQPLDVVLVHGVLKDLGKLGDSRDGADFVGIGLMAMLITDRPVAYNLNYYAARVREMTRRRNCLLRAEAELKKATP